MVLYLPVGNRSFPGAEIKRLIRDFYYAPALIAHLMRGQGVGGLGVKRALQSGALNLSAP